MMNLKIDYGISALLLTTLMVSAGTACAGSCSLASSRLALGQYNSLARIGNSVFQERAADAQVKVVCIGMLGKTYTIALNSSERNNGNENALTNSGGGPVMKFLVYLDPSFSVIWGDGIRGSVIRGYINSDNYTYEHTVYGRVPMGQNILKPGSLSGSLSMVLNYDI